MINKFDYVNARCVEDVVLNNEVREFGLSDEKGRLMGYRVTICKQVSVADENSKIFYPVSSLGTKYCVTPQALRNGKDFGAFPVRAIRLCDTLQEAHEIAASMFQRAEKAAAKKAAR